MKDSILREAKPRAETRRLYSVRFNDGATRYALIAEHTIDAPKDRSQFVEVEAYESDRKFFEASVETLPEMLSIARRNFTSKLRREVIEAAMIDASLLTSDNPKDWPEEAKPILSHSSLSVEAEFMAITGRSPRPLAEVVIGDARPMLLSQDARFAQLVAASMGNASEPARLDRLEKMIADLAAENAELKMALNEKRK